LTEFFQAPKPLSAAALNSKIKLCGFYFAILKDFIVQVTMADDNFCSVKSSIDG
jgi:hypothetical protein